MLNGYRSCLRQRRYTMTPAQFRTIGAALYGPRWQRALAGQLCIGERQVRHYASGSRPMPADMTRDLLKLLYAHVARLNSLAKSLKL